MLSTTFSSEPRKNGAEDAALGVPPEGGGTPDGRTPGKREHGGARPGLTIFKKDLTRFWPLWAAYALLWTALIPLPLLSYEGERLAEQYALYGLTGWAGDFAMSSVVWLNGLIFSMVYGVLCAMAVWSYLFNSRAANMTHALPVRREGQFAAHFLSGSAFFVLPHAIIAALTLIAGLATGSRGDFLNILGAMGILTLLCLFFFCLATLCAFVTGHILALPVFYLIVNCLVYGVAHMIDWLAGEFLFGFTSSFAEMDVVKWLTPVRVFTDEVDWWYSFTLPGSSDTAYTRNISGIPMPENGAPAYTVTTQMDGLHLVFIYAAVGLILAGLALVLYRRRRLESAGDVVAVGWLRPVFLYGVAFCVALAGAWTLGDLLDQWSRTVLIVLLVVCGMIGYFAARMLLHKSLKVFKDGWKGCAGLVAALLLLCLGLQTDVLGLERAIPEAGQVESVRVSGPSSGPGDSASAAYFDTEDPEMIAKIMAVHQSVIDHRGQLKSALDNYRNRGETLPNGGQTKYFRVDYVLKDGGVLTRDYSLVLQPEQFEDPDSAASALNALVNDREFNREAYGLDDVDENRLTMLYIYGLEGIDSSELTLYTPLADYGEQAQRAEDEYAYRSGGMPAEGAVATESWDAQEEGHDLRAVSQEELAGLWRAVLADFDEGNLGRRWLLYSDSDGYESSVCGVNLSFCWQRRIEDPDGDYYRQMSVDITLTTQAVHTFRALEELGVFDGGGYVTSCAGQRVYPAK